ncbi:MAG TPA: hypothetical protein VNM22_18420 [Candidatus Limnocylindrales bacterium]|nr:hypothetical protein [Candidatus Limnocylindrales bacterium]
MKGLQKYQIAFIVGMGILICMVQEAQAIPAFARKYNTSCATCHEAFPRLNAFGEAFRLNGYKFPNNDAAYIKQEPVTLGQEAYKKLWPKAIWPSDIPGFPPVALRIISDYNVDTGGTKEARSQFEMPQEIELLAAGAMGTSLSFFTEVEFESEEEEIETELTGSLQFENLLGPKHLLNLRVGKLGRHELELFTARDKNRLTFNPYLYSNWTLPYPEGFSTRNLFQQSNLQPGIELNGFGTRWRYAIGVVNGNNGSIEDNNSQKDVYAQLALKFKGLGFDGSSSKQKEEGGTSGTGGWQDDSIIASLLGYRGTALVNLTGDEVDNRNDDFWRFGIGIQGKYRDFKIGTGYIWGSNGNPYGTLSDKSVDSRSWFIEGEYFIYPWVIPSLRYEALSLDLPDVPGLQRDQDRARFITSLTFLVRANVKVLVEGRFATKDERFTKATPASSKHSDDAVDLSLDFAF